VLKKSYLLNKDKLLDSNRPLVVIELGVLGICLEGWNGFCVVLICGTLGMCAIGGFGGAIGGGFNGIEFIGVCGGGGGFVISIGGGAGGFVLLRLRLSSYGTNRIISTSLL
tara:strand:- start:146 stop:478 length:333 start_codon:yes stop_codon:yes gene_type:complete